MTIRLAQFPIDPTITAAVKNAVEKNDSARRQRWAELPDPDGLRELAARIKQHTLDHLDYYLRELEVAVTKRGGHIHFAADGEEASRIILQIAARAKVRGVIKSKSMVSEEIDLAHALETAGYDVVETDLGEFIVQIDNDKPSHIVTPIIHKNRRDIAASFARYFNEPCDDDPTSLTMRARSHLRDKFRRADLGITGGNFVVAESGHVCCVENEGNVRHSTTSARVLVSLVGIEKLVPRMADLAVMLKLLARSATGQVMTVYTSIFAGPHDSGERDGPEEFHLVLLDNGRSEILASAEYRETLRCIRCGACLNVCPVHRNVGGHAYGSVYPGPIGAVITPLLRGLAAFRELPQASSLCGECYEACPVKIDIPGHLISLRRDLNRRRITSPLERWAYRTAAWCMRGPRRYQVASRLYRLMRLTPQRADKTFHQLWSNRDG